jgi:hypothetical protein
MSIVDILQFVMGAVMTCIATQTLAAHIAATLARPLSAAVSAKTTAHLLDSLAAIVSGTQLAGGRAGTRMAQRLGGPDEALAIGAGALVGAPQAALANAMAAHADETDDSHAAGRFHPGCAIVPAALAMAETEKAKAQQMREMRLAELDVQNVQTDKGKLQIDAFNAETNRQKVRVDAAKAGTDIQFTKTRTQGQVLDNMRKVVEPFRSRVN